MKNTSCLAILLLKWPDRCHMLKQAGFCTGLLYVLFLWVVIKHHWVYPLLELFTHLSHKIHVSPFCYNWGGKNVPCHAMLTQITGIIQCHQGVRMGETSTNIATLNMNKASVFNVESGCDVDNPCDSNPCPYHSDCSDEWNTFSCNCEPGKCSLYFIIYKDSISCWVWGVV